MAAVAVAGADVEHLQRRGWGAQLTVSKATWVAGDLHCFVRSTALHIVIKNWPFWKEHVNKTNLLQTII